MPNFNTIYSEIQHNAVKYNDTISRALPSILNGIYSLAFSSSNNSDMDYDPKNHLETYYLFKQCFLQYYNIKEKFIPNWIEFQRLISSIDDSFLSKEIIFAPVLRLCFFTLHNEDTDLDILQKISSEDAQNFLYVHFGIIGDQTITAAQSEQTKKKYEYELAWLAPELKEVLINPGKNEQDLKKYVFDTTLLYCINKKSNQAQETLESHIEDPINQQMQQRVNATISKLAINKYTYLNEFKKLEIMLGILTAVLGVLSLIAATLMCPPVAILAAGLATTTAWGITAGYATTAAISIASCAYLFYKSRPEDSKTGEELESSKPVALDDASSYEQNNDQGFAQRASDIVLQDGVSLT